MRNQIDGLLAYSRVGTGPDNFAPTDCETVLDRVIRDLGAVVAETGAQITHDPLPTVIGRRHAARPAPGKPDCERDQVP